MKRSNDLRDTPAAEPGSPPSPRPPRCPPCRDVAPRRVERLGPTQDRRRAARPPGPAGQASSVMQVELRPIGSIRSYAQNPRLNDAAVDAVAAILREFGFRQPIVVDVE